MGVRLLRVMGWREGQGIGPRRKKTKTTTVSRAGTELKTQRPLNKRVYGSAIIEELRARPVRFITSSTIAIPTILFLLT